jgi:small subunit ribosomal protein S17
MSVASNETGRTQAARRQEVGVVTSDKMKKSVVVTVERIGTHPLYKKVVRTRMRFMAHDENDDCRVGDRVRLEECRPMSARKRWRVAEILDRVAGSDAAGAGE